MSELVIDILTVFATLFIVAAGICAILGIIGLVTVKNEDNIKI